MIDLGNGHQYLLTLQKENQLRIMCQLTNIHITTFELVLSKNKLIKTESEQASRSNYKFTRNTKDRETCNQQIQICSIEKIIYFFNK